MSKEKPSKILDETVETLKKMRLEKGLSHDSLAKKVGISRSAISHIEAGNRRPSLLMAIRIAEALDSSLALLLHHAEKKITE